MNLLPGLLAVTPFLLPVSLAEPSGPAELATPELPSGFAPAPATARICGTVFRDVDGDGIRDEDDDTTMDDEAEYGVEGFRLQVFKNNVPLSSGMDETNEDGFYDIEFEKSGSPFGYLLKIYGPTGLEGRFGWVLLRVNGEFFPSTKPRPHPVT